MPTLQNQPSHLLLFDGICNLCNGSVQFILKRDRREVFHFASIQSATGDRIYREKGLDPSNPKSLLLITPKGSFQESDAVLEIAYLLGGLWQLTYILKLLPRRFRDLIYQFISRNRYKWLGRMPTCALPRPEWKHRFLS